MEDFGEAPVNEYPPGHTYEGWGAALSVGIHLTVIGIVALLAIIFHVKSIRDLMTASVTDPPPPQEMQVILLPDDTPPPPTDHPEWINQIVLQPKPPPPPIEKPKPKPPPQPIVQHRPPPVKPAPTARIVVGSGEFPAPVYPYEAKKMKIQGTVLIGVSFDSTGHVYSTEILSSSGSAMLDTPTRHFIQENWHNPDFAGQTQSVPIRFQLSP